MLDFIVDYYTQRTVFQSVWIIGMVFTMLVCLASSTEKYQDYKLLVFLTCIFFWPAILCFDIYTLIPETIKRGILNIVVFTGRAVGWTIGFPFWVIGKICFSRKKVSTE